MTFGFSWGKNLFPNIKCKLGKSKRKKENSETLTREDDHGVMRLETPDSYKPDVLYSFFYAGPPCDLRMFLCFLKFLIYL